jgi:hypothetical protein
MIACWEQGMDRIFDSQFKPKMSRNGTGEPMLALGKLPWGGPFNNKESKCYKWAYKAALSLSRMALLAECLDRVHFIGLGQIAPRFQA